MVCTPTDYPVHNQSVYVATLPKTQQKVNCNFFTKLLSVSSLLYSTLVKLNRQLVGVGNEGEAFLGCFVHPDWLGFHVMCDQVAITAVLCLKNPYPCMPLAARCAGNHELNAVMITIINADTQRSAAATRTGYASMMDEVVPTPIKP